MKNKIRVVVLMGGNSPEHEISFLSGRNVVISLNPEKYEVFPVVISKGGKWQLTPKQSLLKTDDPLKVRNTSKEIELIKKTEIDTVESLPGKKIDLVFVAMHGPGGEDGSVQGMFELMGIRYTGSDVLASAIGMNKIVFRKIMNQEKLPIPKYAVVKKGENFKNVHKVLKRKPYFVKPFNQGSSVGASIVKKEKDLGKAIKLAHKYSELALVDEYIKGKELTCAVLGTEKPIALPVIEIVPKSDFFDYESKYSESGAEEIVPARISKSMAKKIQDMSVAVFRAVGCRGFARVDFILKDNATPVILEINTIPGLTEMSLLPKAAKAAGIGYPELIDRIISDAIKNN